MIALGWAFERWKQTHERTDEQLAQYLGVPISKLAQLAAESVPDGGSGSPLKAPWEGWDAGESDTPDSYQLEQLAMRFGADCKRLFDLVTFNETHQGR